MADVAAAAATTQTSHASLATSPNPAVSMQTSRAVSSVTHWALPPCVSRRTTQAKVKVFIIILFLICELAQAKQNRSNQLSRTLFFHVF
jgi:hypothetical protein